jgi:hypothetical protein
MKIARLVRMPSHSKSAYMLGWTVGFLVLIACVAILGCTSADQEEFVRQSSPQLLTFDELVQL